MSVSDMTEDPTVLEIDREMDVTKFLTGKPENHSFSSWLDKKSHQSLMFEREVPIPSFAPIIHLSDRSEALLSAFD